MCGDKVVAKSGRGVDVLEFRLLPGVPEWIRLPLGMFRESDITSIGEVVRWAKDRIFPEHRMGAADLLAELDLKSYVPWEIAKKQRASLVHDFYWLKLEDGDDYYTHCARGRMGFSPLEWDYEV